MIYPKYRLYDRNPSTLGGLAGDIKRIDCVKRNVVTFADSKESHSREFSYFEEVLLNDSFEEDVTIRWGKRQGFTVYREGQIVRQTPRRHAVLHMPVWKDLKDPSGKFWKFIMANKFWKHNSEGIFDLTFVRKRLKGVRKKDVRPGALRKRFEEIHREFWELEIERGLDPHSPEFQKKAQEVEDAYKVLEHLAGEPCVNRRLLPGLNIWADGTDRSLSGEKIISYFIELARYLRT